MTFANFSQVDSTLKFELHTVPIAVANGLRRAILSDVPVPGIMYIPNDHTTHDSIKFAVQETSVNNEMIGQRLSLVPIHFTPEQVDTFAPEKYKLVINVKNTTPGMVYVTSKDIAVIDGHNKPYPPAIRDAMFPPNPITKDHAYILPLKPNRYKPAEGERLELEATLKIGTAKQWAGFQVAKCTYEFAVDEALADARLKETIEKARSKRPELSEAEVKALTSDFNATERFQCYARAGVTGEPLSILFKVKSLCGLRPRTIVERAFKSIVDQLSDIGQGKREIDVQIKELHAHVLIHDTGRTISNILHSYMFDNAQLSYVGCNIPHPMANNAMLRFEHKSNASPDEVAEFVRRQAIATRDYVAGLMESWKAAIEAAATAATPAPAAPAPAAPVATATATATAPGAPAAPAPPAAPAAPVATATATVPAPPAAATAATSAKDKAT
jgi:DNA-directed RNA polymerase subunit L